MTNRGKSGGSKTTVIGFAGDVLVDRDDPPSVFKRVRTALDATDILFGNLEGPYTDDPHISPSAGVPVIPAGHNVGVFGPAGFDVMSMANNHIVDAGHDAMLDTARRLNAQGVATCGVGRNLAEARRPAIVEADGVRVAFLAYASVFPSGYEARSNVPGLAPVRGYNHYHDRALNYQSPGTPPIIESIPDQTHLAKRTRVEQYQMDDHRNADLESNAEDRVERRPYFAAITSRRIVRVYGWPQPYRAKPRPEPAPAAG